MTSETVRLDFYSRPFSVEARGSDYINELLKKLDTANKLAIEVDSLNADCLHLGAGKTANLKALAHSVLSHPPK